MLEDIKVTATFKKTVQAKQFEPISFEATIEASTKNRNKAFELIWKQVNEEVETQMEAKLREIRGEDE